MNADRRDIQIDGFGTPLTYAEYLKTQHWERLRTRLLVGDCRRCGLRPAIELHHRTYARLGCERDDDLEPLCAECHGKHHDERRDHPTSPAAGSAWIETEKHLIRAALEDPSFLDRLAIEYPLSRWRSHELSTIAAAMHVIRAYGRELTREAVLGEIAEFDDVASEFARLEPAPDARHHADSFLARVSKAAKLEECKGSVEAIVRRREARNG